MEDVGVSWGERSAFANPLLGLRQVRLALVDSARAAGALDEALRLLLEGREQAPGQRCAFGEELASVYQEMGEHELARREMVALAKCDRGYDGSGTAWFEKAKALTPAGEWPALRDEMIAGMEHSFSRRSCLAHEGLYDELMADIETRPDSSHYELASDARRFRKELGALFPERLLRVYSSAVRNRLLTASKRSSYQAAVSVMPEMTEIEGGVLEAAKLAAYIRTEYPRKSALLDELRRVGW